MSILINNYRILFEVLFAELSQKKKSFLHQFLLGNSKVLEFLWKYFFKFISASHHRSNSGERKKKVANKANKI